MGVMDAAADNLNIVGVPNDAGFVVEIDGVEPMMQFDDLPSAVAFVHEVMETFDAGDGEGTHPVRHPS